MVGRHHWLNGHEFQQTPGEVCTNFRRWWRIGKPGVLQFMRSQIVGHDWTTAPVQQVFVSTSSHITIINSEVSLLLQKTRTKELGHVFNSEIDWPVNRALGQILEVGHYLQFWEGLLHHGWILFNLFIFDSASSFLLHRLFSSYQWRLHSGCHIQSVVHVLSSCVPGSRAQAQWFWCARLVVPTTCGIYSDHGSNPYLLHWQEDSSSVSHQGSLFMQFH